MAILGLVAIWAAVIARSFVRDTRRTIPAAEVRATDRLWLTAAAATSAVPRRVEETTANHGLAELTA